MFADIIAGPGCYQRGTTGPARVAVKGLGLSYRVPGLEFMGLG